MSPMVPTNIPIKSKNHAIINALFLNKVSKLLSERKVPFEEESEIGKKYGQIFSDGSKHWD